ncbi:MAG TPA: VOC family protein [Candidatus Acidoferrales bacterium]|nr:VOC family protein [Candidatus Acidoferrales bacterium]
MEAKATGEVRHLDHFVVPVTDPDRAERFYSGVLGARTLKREGDASLTRIFMKLGQNHIGLFSQNKAKIPKRDDLNSYPRHAFLVPESQYDPIAEKVRRASPLAQEISRAAGLGCVWQDGLAFVDSEGNLLEIAKAKEAARIRVHHLHFDTTDLDESIGFYTGILNFKLAQRTDATAQVGISGGQGDQCVVLHRVSDLSEATKTMYRGRHFAFHVTDESFHAIVQALHRAGIEERDEHGEREGRRPGQLGTYFKEPSGFRLQITNEDSETFARHAAEGA